MKIKILIISAVIVIATILIPVVYIFGGAVRKGLKMGLETALSLPSDLATRTWEEKVVYSNGLTVEMPYKPTLTVKQGLNHYEYMTSAITVATYEITPPEPGASMDLARMAELVVKHCEKEQGVTVKKVDVETTRILGLGACEQTITLSKGLRNLLHRSVYFCYGNNAYAVVFVCPAESEAGKSVWLRLKNGIHYKLSQNSVGSENPANNLPSGMQRRNFKNHR